MAPNSAYHVVMGTAMLKATLLLMTALMPVTARAEDAARQDYSGHWHAVGYVHCENSHGLPLTVYACYLFENFNSPGFKRKDSWFTVRWTADFQNNRAGRMTFSLTRTYVEHVPGSKPVCDNSDLVFFTFNGTCRVTEWGNGHVAVGQSHLPEFFGDHATEVFHGKPTLTLYPEDNIPTYVPAVVGTYTTRSWLARLGLHTVPPGIYGRIQVTRHT